MPTYEYRCATCGLDFEVIQTMSEDPLRRCPKDVCPLDAEKKGTGEVERRISAGTGLVFKGSGFYITDYKGGTSPSAPKKDSGSSSGGSAAS